MNIFRVCSAANGRLFSFLNICSQYRNSNFALVLFWFYKKKTITKDEKLKNEDQIGLHPLIIFHRDHYVEHLNTAY